MGCERNRAVVVRDCAARVMSRQVVAIDRVRPGVVFASLLTGDLERRRVDASLTLPQRVGSVGPSNRRWRFECARVRIVVVGDG
jgi:hypothetical protein